jgi:hypothetical protein
LSQISSFWQGLAESRSFRKAKQFDGVVSCASREIARAIPGHDPGAGVSRGTLALHRDGSSSAIVISSLTLPYQSAAARISASLISAATTLITSCCALADAEGLELGVDVDVGLASSGSAHPR